MTEKRDEEKRKIGGTIGDLSIAVGQDVRDLFIDGYSHSQVLAVAHGEMTLSEMRRQGPANEPVDTQEVLDRIRRRRQPDEK